MVVGARQYVRAVILAPDGGLAVRAMRVINQTTPSRTGIMLGSANGSDKEKAR
jgi:hypothetical protein